MAAVSYPVIQSTDYARTPTPGGSLTCTSPELLRHDELMSGLSNKQAR
ncbi:hypothetical protein RSAG8_10536, partial [Rhizoctonia solani AG-8 WAC10335]